MSRVVVVGLGYVGMPLAQAAVRAGHEVVGLDLSQEVLSAIAAGVSHIDDLSDSDIADMKIRGFSATNRPAVVQGADVVVICVPTPLALDGSPDLGAVKSAVSSIVGYLRRNVLVVLESTTFPGTTDSVIAPLLGSLGVPGADFNLAFSPERVDPGNEDYTITNTPKIVGGVTAECTEAAAVFYDTFVDEVVRAKSSREAETAKLLENTYRHINIALVNELARVCHEMEIDVWDVINCAATKPFGFQAFYPGPGVGGHCIPIDPNYLSYAVRSALGYPLRFVELAQEINSTMPTYVARRAQDLMNSVGKPIRGARIAIVGVTYKADISDERESPAEGLARQLVSLGADLRYLDPHVDSWSPVGNAVEPWRRGEAVDLALVLQHHKAVDMAAVTSAASQVLDTRGKLAGTNVSCL